MNESGSTDKCRDMRIYYYDFLYEDSGQIPVDILEHISACQHCINEIQALKDELAENNCSGEYSSQDVAEITNLELHFAYTDMPVGCVEVRQFLALMASSLEVTAKTPITKHLHNCSSCSDDLNTLKSLQLPEQNLLRLSILMAEQSLASKSEAEIGAKIFQVVSDMQCDNTTINKLVEIVCRPATDIKTIFKFDEDAGCSNGPSGCPESENLSSPAVKDGNEQGQPDSSSKKAPSSAVTKVNSGDFKLSKYLMPIAAAAVLMIAFLFFNQPTVTADYDQIHKALENMKNVHIKKIDPDDNQVIQETWISRELNIKILKSGNQIDYIDINKKLLLTMDTEGSKVESKKLHNDVVQMNLQTMQVPWSLLKYKRIDQLPEGGTCQVVAEDKDAGTKTYELQWSKKWMQGNGDSAIKWIGLVDSKSSLPKKIEWWEKDPSEEDFRLVTITEIKFLETDQIDEVAKSFGF